MSNERPDEFFSWRSRLEPPDALPAQGLDDRALSWKKLAGRLRNDPQAVGGLKGKSPLDAGTPLQDTGTLPLSRTGTRDRMAYRIAAACLLLALIPAALLFHPSNAPNPTVAPNQSGSSVYPSTPFSSLAAPPPARPSVPVAPPSGLASNENSPILRSGPTAKALARPNPPATATHPDLAAAQHPPMPARPDQIPAQHTPMPTRTDPLTLHPDPTPRQKDSPLTPTILAALQLNNDSPPQQTAPRTDPTNKTLINKQLRIVHINELDDHRQLEPAMTSARDREPEIKVLILFNNH